MVQRLQGVALHGAVPRGTGIDSVHKNEGPMNKSLRVLCVVLLAAGFAAPVSAASKAHAVAKLIDLDGKDVGRADFTQVLRGVLIEIEVRSLPPGGHAIMVHATGACDPKKQFTSAGPDLDLDPPRPHGYLIMGGPRPGDFPNQFAGADGTLHATLITNAFSLGGGKKSLFDRDGASIIVNAKADDYITQPDGNAGPRIACGTIVRTVGPGGRKGAARRKHK